MKYIDWLKAEELRVTSLLEEYHKTLMSEDVVTDIDYIVSHLQQRLRNIKNDIKVIKAVMEFDEDFISHAKAGSGSE